MPKRSRKPSSARTCASCRSRRTISWTCRPFIEYAIGDFTAHRCDQPVASLPARTRLSACEDSSQATSRDAGHSRERGGRPDASDAESVSQLLSNDVHLLSQAPSQYHDPDNNSQKNPSGDAQLTWPCPVRTMFVALRDRRAKPPTEAAGGWEKQPSQK